MEGRQESPVRQRMYYGGASPQTGTPPASSSDERVVPIWQALLMAERDDAGPLGRLLPVTWDLDLELTISLDLGPRQDVADLAGRVSDLSVLTDVGSRWGIELSRIYAATEADAPGISSLLSSIDNEASREWLESVDVRRWLRPPGVPDEWWVAYRGDPVRAINRFDIELRAMRDLAVPFFGNPIRVSTLRYENPLELVVVGSGFMIAGLTLAARTVRDWSNAKRVRRAQAREAEAEARMTEARADLYRHLVNEAIQGRATIPVGDLVQIVTPAEVKALNRIAEAPVTLQLPPGADD